MSERFWKKVSTGLEHECWPFTGCRTGGRDGKTYGLFTRSRKEPGIRSVYAHRMAFCLSQNIDITTLEREIVIRHKCDNPICCNPAHLESGSQADNAGDMVARGRSRRGEMAPGAVLTAEKVYQIRLMVQSGEIHRTVAEAFGVSRPTVSLIMSGKVWGWLPDQIPESKA